MSSPETKEELRERVAQASAELSPALAGELVDEVARSFLALHLRDLPADAGTLWIVDFKANALEAVLNPWEPEIIGKQQSLDSGLISTVYFLERSVLESEARENPRFSPEIDSQMSKSTRSLVAAPVYVAERLCGVLSAVRFSGNGPFVQEHLEKQELAAEIMGRLLEASLVRMLCSRGNG